MNDSLSSTTYLDRIAADVARRLEERKRYVPLAVLREAARERSRMRPGPSLGEVLRGPHVALIAEVKRRSPSKGAIRPDLAVESVVEAYAAAGAAAVSVLTEEDHFGGSLADLQAAVAAASRFGLPVLRKDFVIDAYQLWESKAHGASAVLLIAGLLSDGRLAELSALARDVGLGVLLEVHDAAELDRALKVPEAVIGINNRDLRTFQVSLATTLALAGLVPAERVLVAESGIGGVDDVKALAVAGVDAVLVGEALLRQADPGAAARSLLRPPIPVSGRGRKATKPKEGP